MVTKILAGAIGMLLAMGLTLLAADGRSHLVVDLVEASGDKAQVGSVEIVQIMGDGSEGRRYEGSDVMAPYGTYRISVFIEDGFLQSKTVRVSQPEMRIRFGVSLASCCLNLPWGIIPASVTGAVTGGSRDATYTVTLVPIWINNDQQSVVVRTDEAFSFSPIEYGRYVVVLSQGETVFETRLVQLTEQNPGADLAFRRN